ncbi:hypothetical protein DXC22_09085 [Ligilactobacillus salivarius]|uniref:hypothetical protein n=1 Tax=Ligilactobacillus salivarius TaxID=1624 RepID=UPI000E44C497|nr:hypothetical protein [Ligilactobacillus salivarius]RGM22770.1 hypothetical protein DXC22_09085 [Ligilactobacillus salivarius]
MAQRVVLMDEREFDEVMKGLDALPFEVAHTTASNGKYVNSLITISKSKVEESLKAMDYSQLKGKDINYHARVKWVD